MSPTQSLSPTILHKKPGHVIPEDYLKVALIGTTSIGYAIQDVDKDGNAFIFSEKDDAQADIANLIELMNEAKDRHVILWLGRGDKAKGESVQPFIYQVDGEDVLAMFLEGDFPGYSHDNDQTDEKNLLDEIISPSLLKAMKIAGGDGEAFFAELRDPLLHKTLLNTAAHRAVFCFMPLEGDPIAFGDNAIGHEFEWGSSSQGKLEMEALEKKPAPAASPAATAEPKRGGFLKKAGTAMAAAVATATKPTEKITTDNNGIHHVKKDDPPAGTQPAKTETAQGTPQKIKLEIPRAFTRKERQAFIRKHTGSLPKNYKNMTHIIVEPPHSVDTLAEIERQAAAATNDKKPVLNVVGGTTVKDVKDAATPGTNDRATALAAAEVNLMTLSAKEKQEAEEFILKHLDFNSKSMPDPKEFAKMEAKYGSFSKQVGFEPGRMFFWPPDRVEEFFKRNLKYGVLAFFEMRRRADVAEKALAASNTKLGDLVNTAPEIEATPQQAAPSAAKSGGFLKKKTA